MFHKYKLFLEQNSINNILTLAIYKNKNERINYSLTLKLLKTI